MIDNYRDYLLRKSGVYQMSDSVRAYLRWKFGGYQDLFEFFSDLDIVAMLHMGLLDPCPVSANPFTFSIGGDY